MNKTLAIGAVLGSCLTLVPAQAQDTARYRIEKTDDGYVRMDTDTGAMSICKERGEQLVCNLAADARAAYDEDVAALRKRVDALEHRLAALEKSAEPRVSSALPSNEEIDKTLGIMERFFRRFMDMAKDLDKDEGAKPDAAPPQSGRT